MKKFRYPIWLFCLLFVIPWQDISATHFMGVDITYNCVGPCTYRIYHKTYYDCTGGATSTYIPVSPFNQPNTGFAGLGNLNFQGNGSCGAPTPIGGWVLESWQEVTPLCPAALNPPPGTPSPTGCDGTNPNPPINGVAELVFYREYNFCNVGAGCNSFNITWSNCCRNSTIDSGAADDPIYSGSTVIDLTIQPCNSSPVFTNKPVPYICAGQPFTFNQGAFDPDGDSLSYELGPCMASAVAQVPYNSGYSPNQPLGQTWDVSINPLTGDVTMIPNPTGNEVTIVLCIVVKEWRNGQQIGQVTRDMQVTVIPGCAVPNPITAGIQGVNIGPNTVPADPLSFSEVRTCAGTEICFDIPVISQDPTYTYTISWNQGIPNGTFTDANNPAVSNVITGANPVARFCWTPQPGLDGAFFFVVSVSDDACPVPGFNQFTVIVYVEDVLENSDAIADPIGCNEVQLTALPQSNLPSAYNGVFTTTQWSGNGNLNLNPFTANPSLSHLYPAPNNYFYTLQLEDTFGCQTTITGVANLTTGVTADAGPDLTICSNNTIPLGTPALPGQTYLWTPDSALSNNTQAQPVFTFPNTGFVQASIDYVLEVTDGICTTFDYVTVNVNPTLQTNILPANPQICNGDSIDLVASGNLAGGNTYLWSTGSNSQTLKVAPTVTTTYSVVTFNSGCSSDPVLVTVEVLDGPDAQIGGDLDICEGEATTLNASGANTYQWSAGNFMGPSITLASIFNDSTISVVGFDALGCPGDTAVATIRTLPQPVANFTTNNVCQGTSTAFADNSTVPQGSIVRWEWDFGDGSPPESSKNPSHTYATAGMYPVQLTVTTENGCTDIYQENITVLPVPEVDFTFTNVCEGSPNTFTDASNVPSGTTITSYTWDFGDGSAPGSGSNTSHTFPSYGYYNVTLTTQADNGCSSSYTQTVFANPRPIPDFDVVSACQDSLVLVSTSSTVPGSLDFIQSHEWDFGDPSSGSANTSTNPNPTHIYDQSGFYPVTLLVTTDKGCSAVLQREVQVYPDPVADFVYDNTCENAFIQFTNLTQTDPNTPVEITHWDFGNGQTANSRNAVYRYDVHTGAGTYPVTLAVKTSAGCIDTLVREMIINPAPIVSFNATRECLNDTTQFSDETVLASGNISAWSWDFGDGSGSSDLQNPIYSYQNPGVYSPVLTVVSDSGCSRVWQGEAIVHELPDITNIQEETVCFGSVATLLVVAPSNVRIDWYYGPQGGEPFHSGYSYTTPPLPYASTYYAQPVSPEGCINERQAVTASTWPDEQLTLLSSTDVVEMPLAVVDFRTEATIELDSWIWNFGDGNSSDLPTPSHEYLFPGIYNVMVRALDIHGCELTDQITVEVKKLTGVTLPSAFSPNGDGYNDTYKIGHYKLSAFNFQVFNRWGQLVYETDNPDFEWDGTTLKGGKAQEGVYVYVLDALDFEGIEIKESRTITVLK